MESTICVQNLGKRFELGESCGSGPGMLRESIMRAAGAPIRWGRQICRAGRETRRAPRPEVWAARGISFDVARGEAIGIIGRNGAGKSTLLKILSRITTPTEGTVRIRGRVGSLLEVGTGFHPELTGRENVFLNGAIIGMSRREIKRKFDEIVAFSEIERFIDTPVKRYSSGMYVRLAFAVAAHLEPDVLLIDEVLSVGDLAFQRKCMEHAKRLRDRDVSLLFVSHNMFTIKAMCPRCIYLAEGRAVADGRTEDVAKLYDEASSLDVADWARGAIGADPAKWPIQVYDVECRNERGEPCSMFGVGERVRLRLRYELRDRIDRPNFNVAIVRSDGVACCNYNTSMDRFPTEAAADHGVIGLLTPPLKLVSESYSLQVLVWDAAFQKLYCAQSGPSFHVRDETLNTHFGVFHEAADWRWGD